MTTPGCSDIRVTGVDGETIYRWFTEGPRPASSTDPLAESWGQIQTQLAQVRESVQKVLSDAGAVWSGESADAMQAAVAPMATWADNASTAAAMAKSAVTMQSGDFGTASSSVVPVASEPDKPWQAYVPLIGGALGGDDYDTKMAERAAQTAHNQAVATSYAGNSASNVSYMPQFAAPPTINSGVAAPTTQPPGVGGGPDIPGQVGGAGASTGSAGFVGAAQGPGVGASYLDQGSGITQQQTGGTGGGSTGGSGSGGGGNGSGPGSVGAATVGTVPTGPGGGAGTSPAGIGGSGVGGRNPGGAGTGDGAPGSAGTRRGSGFDGAGGVGGVGSGRGSAGAGSLGGRGLGAGGTAG
ncbi:PPE domain-containing protein, partial [Rhodococcus aerolatus]